MNHTSVGILILHATILCLQLLAAWVFPTQRKAVFGIYLVLIPVGFGFFASPEPGMTLGLVLVGLIYILYMANKSVLALSGNKADEKR